MKNTILIVALALLTAPFAFANPSLCPAGSTEISSCVSNDTVPLYPYISICQTGTTYTVAMDEGSTGSPDIFNASRTDAANNVAFAVTDADSDGIQFTIQRCTCADDATAKLTYSLFGSAMESDYTCKSQIH